MAMAPTYPTLSVTGQPPSRPTTTSSPKVRPPFNTQPQDTAKALFSPYRRAPLPNTQHPLTITHERDIPSLSTKATLPTSLYISTSLSFALPTSLAFAKRTSWEQTPWIRQTLHSVPTVPLSKTSAARIHTALHSQFPKYVTPRAIENAMVFGSTDPGATMGEMGVGAYPVLYIIFPHAPRLPAHDEAFLKIWHNDIVKSAFDSAWKTAAPDRVTGAHVDGLTRIMPATGTTTSEAALPFAGFARLLGKFLASRNADGAVEGEVQAPIRDFWPSWSDVWGPGSEGRFSALRSAIYDEAWVSMVGMLRDHPQLGEYQDPVLLAACHNVVHFADGVDAGEAARVVGRVWDGCVDGRFVADGSFGVVMDASEEEEIKGKRAFEGEMGGEGDGEGGHRAKRRKQGHETTVEDADEDVVEEF